MEIITVIFKIINDRTILPKCFSFVFNCKRKQKHALFFYVKTLQFQGWVSSGRNLFLPGHLEETGKNWKKVVFSALFRKKVEEIGIK